MEVTGSDGKKYTIEPGADLSGANLSNTSLSGTDLSGASLRRADLRGMNLSNTNLSEADLSGARLSGANLREANLSRTNLNGAILIDADLSGVNLNGVTYDDKTVFPGGFDPLSSSVKEADPLRPSMGGSSAEAQSDQPIVDGKQQTVPFKYPALRVISGFYRGLAYAIGGLALLLVLVGFVSLVTYNYDGRWAIGLGVMFFAAVGGALGVISMLAISEVIILQVDIAHDVNAIKREVQDGE